MARDWKDFGPDPAGDPDSADRRRRALLGAMSEGYALCQAIRDHSGDLVDYRIVEINPALSAMFGLAPGIESGRFSETGIVHPDWLPLCDTVLRTGQAACFETFMQGIARWHEVRVNRIAPDWMTQVFSDITERRAAASHQAQLFEELKHRMKNNLGMVSAMLSMQARGASAEVRDHLLKAADRVQSISDVNGALYATQLQDEIDLGDYLASLCRRLSQSLLDGDRVTIDVRAAAIAIPTDQAASLGMIVNELVTNAAKYAFPYQETGAIRVRLEQDNKAILMSVADNGAGLPPDFDSRPGLGMRLVRSLVKQLGASLTFAGSPGATFVVRLPRPPAS
jgi:two-component sensor histidine kinase